MFIVRVVRWGHHGQGHRHHDDNQSPLDHLKARYAKGEIDKAEYDRVRKDLES